MEVYSLTTKENSTPEYRNLHHDVLMNSSPANGSTQDWRSRMSRRHNARLDSLTRSPPRSSYQTQMWKHWARSMPAPHYTFPSGRHDGFPPPAYRMSSSGQISHQLMREDSACEMHSSGDSGVPLNDPAIPEIHSKKIKLCDDSPSSLDEGVPLNNIERAVMHQFGTPSPTRQERRKTLHIPQPAIERPIDTTLATNKDNNESSSESWTGDDIFFRKVSRPPLRHLPSSSSTSNPPSRPPLLAVKTSSATNIRSPLRQAQNAPMNATPLKRSRFRVPVPMENTAKQDVGHISDHLSSDADDEDEGEDEDM